MHFNDQFSSSLRKLEIDPLDKQATSELSAGFWFWLSETLGILIREKNNISEFFKKNNELINYGIHGVLVDPNHTSNAICDSDLNKSPVKVVTVTEWITDLLLKIRQGNQKNHLQKEIKLLEIQHRKLESEVANLQNKRRERIENAQDAHIPDKLNEKLVSMDNLQLEILRAKLAIQKGMFLSVQQRREHHDREKQFEKDHKTLDTVLSSIADKEIVSCIKKCSPVIKNLYLRMLESQDSTKQLNEDIGSIQNRTSEIPVLEIENELKREIDNLRNIVKSSSRREGLEGFPLIRSGDKVFSFKNLINCLNQIMEFDPHLFRNSRVPLFGKPYILIVPGRGTAVYDWKNNCIILPLVAPAGNYMSSLARGMIEYRLEVDEDRMLLNSFCQIPDLKNIRSFAQQKKKLIKDYIIWMTSEFKGYRILSKPVKDWFEREIAPSQNDIWTPFEYQWYSINSAEFKQKLAELAAKIEEPSLSSVEDLWGASILYYQKGEYDTSANLLEALVQKEATYLMAWYNLGFVSLKNGNYARAKHALGIFCSMNPQSWWTRIAQSQLRKLESQLLSSGSHSG
ncbi:MAG: hypothetical protein ACLFQB_12285 [Chitinispirillaceae bacterium]